MEVIALLLDDQDQYILDTVEILIIITPRRLYFSLCFSGLSVCLFVRIAHKST